MTLPDSLRAALDTVRSIPARLGLRPFDVTVLVRQWSGERPGDGYATDTAIPLTNDGYAVRVRQLNQRDVMASGGLYQLQDLEVTFTPSYTFLSMGGGFDVSDFDLPTDSDPVQVVFHVTGPGFETGAWFKKIGQRVDSSLTYRITLRRTGETF